ncbi:MAG: tetratricopeptide repeat protein [Promethearchaeota archaeon]
MAKVIQTKLAIIAQLKDEGEYEQALTKLRSLAFEELTPEIQFSYKLLESQLLLSLDEVEKAQRMVFDLLQSQSPQIDPLLTIDAMVVQAELYWRSAEMTKALETAQKGLDLLKEIDSKQETEINQRKAALLNQAGIAYWYKGKFDTALNYHLRSLEIKQKLNDKRGVARSFNNLGLVYWSKGDIDQALAFYHRALKVNEELVDRRNIGVTLTNLGNCYIRIGELDKALVYHQRSLKIKEELGNKHDIALSLLNLGVIFQFKGDLNQAQDYYHRSLVLGEELNIQTDIALAVNNIGDIYELKGDFEEALKYYQRSLKIYEELELKDQIALLQANIGSVYQKKAEYQRAQDCYEKSLALSNEFGNDFLASVVLFELVRVGIEIQDSALIEHSLAQLGAINARRHNRVIDQRYRVAKALILKTSKRTRQKLKASEILEEVVTEEVVDHSLKETAMIHLCDLLLTELRLTGEDELIGDISQLTKQLLEIAKLQSSPYLLAEAYLLQSKLALVEMDMGRANKLLTQAQAIAEEMKLKRLEKVLSNERKLLDSHMKKWDLIVKDAPSRQELIELTKLDALLERMIKETVTNIVDQRTTIDSAPIQKYNLVYLDLLKDQQDHEKTQFKVGIAQIGLSQSGDILHEYYQEDGSGLFRIRQNKIKEIQSTVRRMIEAAAKDKIKILAFPELTIDLNSKVLFDEVISLAKTHNMYIIPGSYHKTDTRQNVSTIISREGILWEQAKHIPAIIHYQKHRIIEGITTSPSAAQITIANTEYGRIAVIICRDFLDMDLRVELKNFEPAIDIIINPAFTPVTADFKAIHFDARRSIYAYSFFINVAEFGDSLIYSPEKDREERTMPKGQEGIIYKEIDLFKLRSERKKWEQEQKKTRPFIQSTR